MNSKKILLTAFILMAIIQLAIPGKMIWDREKILETGKVFKFETAPFDPSDPFRGKFIVLRFKENSIAMETDENFLSGEEIYVILKKNQAGFATIDFVTKEKPAESIDYVIAKIDFVSGSRNKTINISYPFDRFYMEESKAYDAEKEYIKSQRDTSKTTYALVRIKDGEAVLKDVFIDEISIREIVNKIQ